MKRKARFALFLCIALGMLLLAGACNTRSRKVSDALLYTDSLFSASSEEYGSNQAFERFAHPDVILLRNRQYPVIGKQQLLSMLASQPDTGFMLKWKPRSATMASSKDLGFTWGTYWVLSRTQVPDTLKTGSYITIWKKVKGGSWKFVFDAGCEGPEKKK